MEPTTIYVKPLLELIKKSQVNALAHITGGGLLENIPRVLPENAKAVIDTQGLEAPSWSSTGCKKAAISTNTKCTAPLTVALAW